MNTFNINRWKRLAGIIKETIEYISVDEEGFFDEFEELDINLDDAYKIAQEGNVNILSNKNLSGVLFDDDNNEVVGGLWTTDDPEEAFSFDIAVAKKYRGQGLAHKLIGAALDLYNDQNYVYKDINDTDEDLPIELDVVNPMIVKTLKNKYGFRVVDKITNDRVLMSL
jgi:ribosomal protein S18 acetylase RimI-like enzyme